MDGALHKIANDVITYSTGAIKTSAWFETTLDYKTRILGPKIEDFPLL